MTGKRERALSCAEAVGQLWSYLDRALSSEDFARVEEHLAFCRQCCGELEFAKQLRAFLASDPVEEIPPYVRQRLERFVDEM
jgi:mycothiol system anti-sigma-R factor